jgi:glycosyltransferase involved in cell wall biosynthesis
LIADDPKNFAEQVINLLLRESLREQLSSNATRLVKDIYDWQVIMPHFLRLVDKVAAG